MLISKSNFAANLKEARSKAGLSQKAISGRMNFSLDKYRAWEDAESDRWPDALELFKLGAIVQVSPWHLVGDDKPYFRGEINSDRKKQAIFDRVNNDVDFFLFVHRMSDKHNDVIKAANTLLTLNDIYSSTS